jgi:multidrug efflux system membrane fusion protein
MTHLFHRRVRRRADTSYGLLLIAATAFAAGCSGEAAVEHPAAESAPADTGVPVTIARAERKPMTVDVSGIGTVEASSTVSVRSQMTGALMSVSLREGEDVKQGLVLFTLDSRPLDAALQQAQANLARDTAQAANAKVQAGRLQELANRGIVSKEQLQTSATTAAALDATVEADRAAVENARLQAQYATITAPISGRTGALLVHEGNLVRANDTNPLVVINQVSPVYVSFSVPEAQLPDFNRYLAQRALAIEALPTGDSGAPSKGRVSFVDNSVDPTTGTIRIKGTFTNADRRLWPGQFVNVVVTLATDPDAVVVPTVAVQNGQQGQFVFVVKDDKTVELKPVTVARTSGDESVVTRGLSGGETVVTDGQIRLVPGSRISVKTDNVAAVSE